MLLKNTESLSFLIVFVEPSWKKRNSFKCNTFYALQYIFYSLLWILTLNTLGNKQITSLWWKVLFVPGFNMQCQTLRCSNSSRHESLNLPYFFAIFNFYIFKVSKNSFKGDNCLSTNWLIVLLVLIIISFLILKKSEKKLLIMLIILTVLSCPKVSEKGYSQNFCLLRLKHTKRN